MIDCLGNVLHPFRTATGTTTTITNFISDKFVVSLKIILLFTEAELDNGGYLLRSDEVNSHTFTPTPR